MFRIVCDLVAPKVCVNEATTKGMGRQKMNKWYKKIDLVCLVHQIFSKYIPFTLQIVKYFWSKEYFSLFLMLLSHWVKLPANKRRIFALNLGKKLYNALLNGLTLSAIGLFHWQIILLHFSYQGHIYLCKNALNCRLFRSIHLKTMVQKTLKKKTL